MKMSKKADDPVTELNGGSVASNGSGDGADPKGQGHNYDVTQNGHLSPSNQNGLSNGDGLSHDGQSSPTPPTPQRNGQSSSSGSPRNDAPVSPRVSPPTGVVSPQLTGAQPNCQSPTNQPSSGGDSPSMASPHIQIQGPGGPPLGTGQHVVHVHVNPGETFTVRVGDQFQHIQGPATVRMVSNNGPPMPMPMQVPPGHMVQQIVDENGILTHVILSPQPPGIPGPPMTVGYYGPNSGPQQYYPTYGPQGGYGPPPPSGYPHHHPHGPAGPMPQGVPPQHIHTTPPPNCNSHGPIPVQVNPSSHLDERTQRTKERLQKKIYTRRKENYHSTPPRRKAERQRLVNGDQRRHDAQSSSSSGDGQELEEEKRAIKELLSHMKAPKISNVESRRALIELLPPECDNPEFDINPSEFLYELYLADDGKDGKYDRVYNGDATVITLKDLKPAREYNLRVCSILDEIKGDQTVPVSFRTLVCEPETPKPPKLSSRTKTSIFLKWNTVADNGAKISSYLLEYDQGKGNGCFVEVYNGLQRQFKVTKLTTSTGYVFRVCAVNSVGKSGYSDAVCYYTSGSAPSQPDPPMLSDRFVNKLTISWIKRPNDDHFSLQMEDESTGHGFMPVYNGPDLSTKVEHLRRNTEYKFRLSANNDEGNSKWSEVISYRTLPDKPSPPVKLQTKGKVHSTTFRVIWEPPKDTGGSEISSYKLEMDEGKGFEVVYEGSEREHTCDHLMPGHVYRLRVACNSAGGQSGWSDMCNVTTLCVPPGPCQPPKLQGRPKATYLHLRWAYPDYDGGAEVSDFEVEMLQPDGSMREVYKGRDLDCMVAGLLPGRPYLYRVRGTNKAGTGPWSEMLEVVSGPGAPDAPKTPTTQCRSPQSAIVSWDEPVNNGATVTEYRLEWQQRQDVDFTQLYNGAALSFEVRGLSPATCYSFRVQASNNAGTGPFSGTCTCMTPPSSPGPVTSIRATSTADTLTLTWKEPVNNGSEIVAYNIDLGERHHLISVENVTEYTVQHLMAETTYKVRIQAVNGIGVGQFSSAVKVTTRALPPHPPKLECVSCGPNALKLKWGDGKNLDMIQYTLEMLRDGGFHQVFQGTSHTHKVSRLNELTSYEFRISASNEAGEGPYSNVYTFQTTKAPPPAVKPPKVSELTIDSCRVEWQPCKPMGEDRLSYTLQLQTPHGKDQDYKQVYRGTDPFYHLTALNSKTEYQVRVCAVRQCSDSSELTGAFSSGVSFTTHNAEPAPKSCTKLTEKRVLEPKQLTDQQWAVIILAGFALFAILVAMLANKIIAYQKHGAST